MCVCVSMAGCNCVYVYYVAFPFGIDFCTPSSIHPLPLPPFSQQHHVAKLMWLLERGDVGGSLVGVGGWGLAPEIFYGGLLDDAAASHNRRRSSFDPAVGSYTFRNDGNLSDSDSSFPSLRPVSVVSDFRSLSPGQLLFMVPHLFGDLIRARRGGGRKPPPPTSIGHHHACASVCVCVPLEVSPSGVLKGPAINCHSRDLQDVLARACVCEASSLSERLSSSLCGDNDTFSGILLSPPFSAAGCIVAVTCVAISYSYFVILIFYF